ncbi:MAG: 50S ribosomal protein L4 [bacterium]
MMKEAEKNLVAEALHYQRSAARQDTAARKSRSEVSGGGKKPWRQKGTGRARQGSTRAVQWRGGGCAFGSSRSSHEIKMNSKARKKAMGVLLSDFERRGSILIEELIFEKPSTKQFVRFMEEKGLNGKGLILCEKGYGENVIKSVRNIPNVICLRPSCLNYHDLLDADWILVSPQDRHIVESKISVVGEG